MSKYLAISLIIASFIFGSGFGYYFSPEYSMGVSMQQMDLGSADRNTDLRYLNLMATHHVGAIRLAEQVKQHSQRPEMQNLADAIITGEPKLIARLEVWKKEWYKDYKPTREPVKVNLGTYDANFDLRFLNALISHHQDGIAMSKDIQSKSTRNEVIGDAQSVQEFLTNGTEMLKTWRQEWYGI